VVLQAIEMKLPIRSLYPQFCPPGTVEPGTWTFLFLIGVLRGGEEDPDAVVRIQHRRRNWKFVYDPLQGLAHCVPQEYGVHLSHQRVDLLQYPGLQVFRMIMQGKLQILLMNDVRIVSDQEVELFLENITGDHGNSQGLNSKILELSVPN
jgi:hypothetical protein